MVLLKEEKNDSHIFLEPELLIYEATIKHIDKLTKEEDGKDR